MEVLLRERRQLGTAVEYYDREINARIVTIGSAPDQTVQLLGEVAARHASISGKSGAVRIDCSGNNRLSVNGKTVRSAKLEEGDRIELAGHVLQVISAPAGFDLGIEITPNTDVRSSAFEAAFQTRLNQTLLGKRTLSWSLLAAVLLAGLGIPLYLTSRDDADTRTVTTWPLDDRFWSTGPLLPAHQLTIGADCSACHVELFQRVQDQQCTTCHSDLQDHLREPIETNVGSDRCASCHREHNDPQHFVMRRDTFCTDCHADPQQFPEQIALDAVSGFSKSVHPPFDVHLLVPRAERDGDLLSFVWEDQVESLEDAKEQSNLKFPHDIHLDPSKVLTQRDSTALGCGDCHVLSTDREHFVPVEMERHCRDCHDLKFDPVNPTRELPHGQPREVIFAIEGYFFSKYRDPNATESTIPRRRVPWSRPDGSCTRAADDCALAEIAEEIANQFARRGCVTCHLVDDNGSENIEERFQVHPVRLQRDYYPASTFPHDTHLTQDSAVGDDACVTCHTATQSNVSDELMIPGIDTCVGCHGDEAIRDKVSLNCVSCHSYHPRPQSDVLAYPAP